MRKRILAALALLVATAVAGCATGAPGETGVSVGGNIQNEPPATLARDLDAVQAAKAQWIRIDINWAQVQASGPGVFDWSKPDSLVNGAKARGISVDAMIGYTPAWARPTGSRGTYGPDPTAYAAFAKAAAARYAPLGVHTYEVWNEPNTTAFWTPKPDPAAYTRLLRAAHDAIRATDPAAKVLTGGTSPAPSDGTQISPADFLKGIYANGGATAFEAVAHHPYCYPAYPGDTPTWSAWYQMYGTSPSLRSVMTANGDAGKQVWATEFGAPTNGPNAVSESTQAAMIARAYQLYKNYPWAGPLFVYQGRDEGTDTAKVGDWFGLLRYDFTAKPAYTAFQQAAPTG